MTPRKETPVTAIDGYVSVVCAGGRHTGCRPDEWSCSCTCHETGAGVAPSEPVEDVAAEGVPHRGEHTDRSPGSDGGAAATVQRIDSGRGDASAVSRVFVSAGFEQPSHSGRPNTST